MARSADVTTTTKQNTLVASRTLAVAVGALGFGIAAIATAPLFFGGGPLSFRATPLATVPTTCLAEDLPTFGRLRSSQEVDKLRSALGPHTLALRKALVNYRYDAGSAQRQTVVITARERKTTLLNLAASDPSAVAGFLLNSEDRQTVARAGSGCAEQPTIYVGTLRLLHADFFLEGRDDERPFLQEENGNVHSLVLLDGNDLPFPVGSKLRVHALTFDGLALMTTGKKSPGSGTSGTGTVVTSTASTAVAPIQSLAVLPAILTSADAPPLVSVTNLQTSYFGAKPSLADYWGVTSYGHINVPGAVIDNGQTGDARWIPLNIAATCNYWSIAPAAVAAADPYVDFSSTKHLSVIIEVHGCTWGGISVVGGLDYTTQEGIQHIGVDLISACCSGPITIGYGTPTHEFGHSLGLNHSNFFNCGTTSLGPTGCTVIEYGDYFDIMGGSGNLNAPHMEALGLFNSGNLHEITASGTYTLNPIEDNSASLKTIRVQRGLGPDYMYVEYRQPRAYDDTIFNAVSTNVFQGALVHITPNGAGGITGPYIIDASVDGANPGSSYYPALLPVGETLTDPKTGTAVTINSISTPGDPGATLTVNFALLPDIQPPSVSFVAGYSVVEATGTQPVQVYATAADNVVVSRIEFYQEYLDTPSEIVSMGSSQSTFPGVLWDAATLPNGLYRWTARAYDLIGNHSDAVITVTLNNAAPTVTIIAPPNNQTVNSIVTVNASATDNPPIVVEVDYYLDSNLLPFQRRYFPDTSLSSATLNTTTISNGVHVLTVKAIDQVGRLGVSAPVTINVSNFISSPSPSGCFTFGTMVDTPDGPRPIGQIRAGDSVYSYNPTTDRAVVSRVTRTYVHTNEPYGVVTFSDGTRLQVTAVHRFYNPQTRDWQEIGTMHPGDFVLRGLGSAAKSLTIRSLEFTSGQGTVYNLEIDRYQTYYANGVLVHNAKQKQ
jgi:hypothetical protein